MRYRNAFRAGFLDGIVGWAEANRPDLVVVGLEAPLVKGLVDRLAEKGIVAFGPVAAGARMEGSKRFAKEVMAKAGVPTGQAEVHNDAAQAKAALGAQTAKRVPATPFSTAGWAPSFL